MLKAGLLCSDIPAEAPDRRWNHVFAAGCLSLLALVGCQGTVPAEDYREVQRQLQAAQEQSAKCAQELLDAQQANRTLQDQIARLSGLSTDQRQNELILPTGIKLANMSGGYDNDNQPGDDGIVLYIQPIDRDGQVLKLAGTLKIRVLDLQSPPESMVISEQSLDAQATQEAWYGRLWTNHFTVRCPWPQGRTPAHDQVTAHVTFTDLLTGRIFTTQQTFKVRLPASAGTQASP